MKEWDTVVDFEEYVKALQRDAEAPLATASTYGVRAVAGTLSRLKDKASQCSDVEERYILLFRLAALAAKLQKHPEVKAERPWVMEVGKRALSEIEDLDRTQLTAVYCAAMKQAKARQEERRKQQQEEAKVLEIKRQREEEMEKRRKEAELEREQQEAERRAQEQKERQEKQEYWREVEAKQRQEMSRQQQEQYLQWRRQQDEMRLKLEHEQQQRREWERQRQERNRRLFWAFNPQPGPAAGRAQPRRGLVNLGNTCYMNSVLQALFGSPLAAAFLQNTKDLEKDLNVNNKLGFSGRVAGAFFQVMSEMNHPASYPVQPRNFKQVIGDCNATFQGFGQQDSHDFMRTLLDGLHEDLNRVKQRTQSLPEVQSKGRDVQEVAQESWQQYKTNNDSLLVDLFGFLEKSKLTCTRCGEESTKFSPMMSLEVPIPTSANAVELEDCLRLHVQEEVLAADSQWECSGCKAKVRARKKLDLWSAPSVLVITLKRFHPTAFLTQSYASKVTKDVYIPQDLDLSDYLPPSGTTSPYRLFGIINHEGTMNGGHYTAEVKGRLDGVWYWFSDERFQRAGSYKPTQAYQLLYQRMAGRPKPLPPQPSPAPAGPSLPAGKPAALPPIPPPTAPGPAGPAAVAAVPSPGPANPGRSAAGASSAAPSPTGPDPATPVSAPNGRPATGALGPSETAAPASGTASLPTAHAPADSPPPTPPAPAQVPPALPAAPPAVVPNGTPMPQPPPAPIPNGVVASPAPYGPAYPTYSYAPMPPGPPMAGPSPYLPTPTSPPPAYGSPAGPYVANGPSPWAAPPGPPAVPASLPYGLPASTPAWPPAPVAARQEVDLLQFDKSKPTSVDLLDEFFAPLPVAAAPSPPPRNDPSPPMPRPNPNSLPSSPAAPSLTAPFAVAFGGSAPAPPDASLQALEAELRQLEQQAAAQAQAQALPTPQGPSAEGVQLSAASVAPASSGPARRSPWPSDPGQLVAAVRQAAVEAEQQLLKLRVTAHMANGRDTAALREDWQRLNEQLIDLQVQLDGITSAALRPERKRLIDVIHEHFTKLDAIKASGLG